MPHNEDGWLEWKNHVLLELQRFNSQIQDMDTEIKQVLLQLEGFRVRANLVGSLLGFLGGLVSAFLVEWFYRK